MVHLPQVDHPRQEECRALQQRNQQTANFAQWSGYPPATATREHPPAISFNALEAPKANHPQADNLWPSAPTNKPIASFDSSGLFGAFKGADGEDAGGPGFWRRARNVLRGIRETLSPIVHALDIMTIVHYIWLMFGNSFYSRATPNLADTAETFGESPTLMMGRLSRQDQLWTSGLRVAITLSESW